MNINNTDQIPFIILLIGVMIIMAILLKTTLRRFGIPPLIGFIALGLMLRLLDIRLGYLSHEVKEAFRVFANVGIIALLFRVGLESKLAGLLRQLRKASIIWIGDVLVSGSLGFVVSHFIISLNLIPSLIIATAMTATSVGVSIAIWKDMQATNSKNGELLIDVAEMDDVSGVILMALLFSVIPVLKGGLDTKVIPVLGSVAGIFLLKLLGFGMFCILFALYAERRILKFFGKMKHMPDPMLFVAGTGFIIASIAGLIGFSAAIGAFFAGLIFSRDPRSAKIDESFGAIYGLFVPFFFIGIGLNIDPKTFDTALKLSGILVFVAMAGKLLGAGCLTFVTAGWVSSVLIGLSMIPRAEIAMVIMQKGLRLGEWAVPHQVFSAMVLVSVLTCFISPIVLQGLLRRWPQKEEKT
jgi:Kef-type K+ transport system membrane component KefB